MKVLILVSFLILSCSHSGNKVIDNPVEYKVLNLSDCGFNNKNTLCTWNEFPDQKITLLNRNNNNICYLNTNSVIQYVVKPNEDREPELVPKIVTEINDRKNCKDPSSYKAFLGHSIKSFTTITPQNNEEINKKIIETFNIQDFVIKNKILYEESAPSSIKEILTYDSKFSLIKLKIAYPGYEEEALVLYFNNSFSLLEQACASLMHVSKINDFYMIEAHSARCGTCDPGRHDTFLLKDKLILIHSTSNYWSDHN